MRRRVGPVALVVAACALSCSSAGDQALGFASREARDEVERARQWIEGRARAEAAAGPAAALAAAVADNSSAFDRRVVDDGFEVDAAYYGNGTAGGGGSAETVAVRVCVRFVARMTPVPVVEAEDLECPDSLPTTGRGVDPFDRTIRLTDLPTTT